MRKTIGICLGLLLMVTMIGCSASTKDLGETLNEKSYIVEKSEFFGDKFQRQITLRKDGGNESIIGYYDKNNTFLGYKFYGGENPDSYGYSSSELIDNMNIGSDDEQNPLLEKWFEDMETNEEALKEYLIKVGNEKKSVDEVKELVSDKNFDISFRSEPLLKGYDDDMYLYSSKGSLYIDAYFKDGKLSAFIFADGIMGANDLFAYVNDKVLKDDGQVSYMLFLSRLGITHEEFMDFIQSTYESQKGMS